MKTTKIKNVLIALDYDPTSKKVAEQGFALAKAMNAQVTLLHVMVNSAMYATASANMGAWQLDTVDTFEAIKIFETGSHVFLEKTKKFLGDTSIETVLKEGDAAQMILQTATETKADCIVMGSHSQKWFENILMGSVAEDVLRKSTVPLYIIPNKNS